MSLAQIIPFSLSSAISLLRIKKKAKANVLIKNILLKRKRIK